MRPPSRRGVYDPEGLWSIASLQSSIIDFHFMKDAMKELRLYVIGQTTSSIKATKDLRAILEVEFRDQYTLEVIDVLENPSLAEDDKILATPTVVKRLPLPIRKVIGDLREREKVLLGLDLLARDQESGEK